MANYFGGMQDLAAQMYQNRKKKGGGILGGLAHIVGGVAIGMAFPPAGATSIIGGAIGGASSLMGDVLPESMQKFIPVATAYLTHRLTPKVPIAGPLMGAGTAGPMSMASDMDQFVPGGAP